MAKKRFTVTVAPGDYELLRRWADSKGDEAASIASYLIQRGLETAKDKGEIPEADGIEEERELLIGFLNYLIDHFDHDGYSLSEISKILGRSDDKGLVRLVQKLQQNGQEQPTPKVKVK